MSGGACLSGLSFLLALVAAAAACVLLLEPLECTFLLRDLVEAGVSAMAAFVRPKLKGVGWSGGRVVGR